MWCVLLTAGRADGYLGVEDVFAVRWLEGLYGGGGDWNRTYHIVRSNEGDVE